MFRKILKNIEHKRIETNHRRRPSLPQSSNNSIEESKSNKSIDDEDSKLKSSKFSDRNLDSINNHGMHTNKVILMLNF